MLNKILCNTRQKAISLNYLPKNCLSTKFDAAYFTKNNEMAHKAKDVLQKKFVYKKGDKESTITLYGIPHHGMGDDENQENLISSLLEKPSAANAIQIDPTNLLQIIRNAAKKLAADTEPQIWDPIFPYSVEELLLDKILIQSIASDSEFNQKPLDQGIHAQIEDMTSEIKDSNLKSKEKERLKAIFQVIMSVLSEQEGQLRLYDFDSLLFSLLVSEINTYLGGTPKIYSRISCVNNAKLDQLKEAFVRICVTAKLAHSSEFDPSHPELSYYTAADYFYPEIFQMPGYLYQTLLLKELAEGNQNVNMIVGVHQVTPLYDLLHEEKLPAAKFDDLLKIPERNKDDTVDTLIEKFALLEILHGDNLWARPYIIDKFPYLTVEEKKEIGEAKLKEKFAEQYGRYKSVKEKLIQEKGADKKP